MATIQIRQGGDDIIINTENNRMVRKFAHGDGVYITFAIDLGDVCGFRNYNTFDCPRERFYRSASAMNKAAAKWLNG